MDLGYIEEFDEQLEFHLEEEQQVQRQAVASAKAEEAAAARAAVVSARFAAWEAQDRARDQAGEIEFDLLESEFTFLEEERLNAEAERELQQQAVAAAALVAAAAHRAAFCSFWRAHDLAVEAATAARVARFAAFQAACCAQWCNNVAQWLARGGNSGRIITGRQSINGVWSSTSDVFGVPRNLVWCELCGAPTADYGPLTAPVYMCMFCNDAFAGVYPW